MEGFLFPTYGQRTTTTTIDNSSCSRRTTPSMRSSTSRNAFLVGFEFLPSSEISTQQFVGDVLVFGVLGFAVDPLVETIFKSNPKLFRRDGVDAQTTFAYGAADSISTAARIYGVFVFGGYLNDYLALDIMSMDNNHEVATKVATTIWGALTIATVKRTLFLQQVAGKTLGRVELYDRLIDFILIAITGVVVLDELHIDIGMGLMSIFTASGVGALLFSLASKDLAEQITGGLILQAWDAFKVGDDVLLGDGTEGTIVKLGLVETEIKGGDNIIIKIPNSQITKQRISNISRMKQSRIQQTLRFSYKDIDILPDVLQDIKIEISQMCDSDVLITDGSKSFGAAMSSYEADHIKCVVTCHFNVPPYSKQYNENKVHVLLAIAKAVKKNNIEFAIPAIYNVNSK